MQQPQHFYNLPFSDPEHHEVATFSAMPGNMQGANARGYFVPRLGPQDRWTVIESLDCQRHCLCVGLGLPSPKVLCRPF